MYHDTSMISLVDEPVKGDIEGAGFKVVMKSGEELHLVVRSNAELAVWRRSLVGAPSTTNAAGTTAMGTTAMGSSAVLKSGAA